MPGEGGTQPSARSAVQPDESVSKKGGAPRAAWPPLKCVRTPRLTGQATGIVPGC